jgi:hypothetical protein
MVVGVGFCKIKVDSNFLLVLKIKCTKFHQDRSKTVDLHTKYTNRHSVLYILMTSYDSLNGHLYAPNLKIYYYEISSEVDLQALGLAQKDSLLLLMI